LERSQAGGKRLNVSAGPGLNAPEIEGLARKLLFSRFNSPSRRKVLEALASLDGSGATMTSFVRSLSLQGVSEATARRAVQELRELEIVSCGSSASKGIPLSLTAVGKKVLGVRK